MTKLIYRRWSDPYTIFLQHNTSISIRLPIVHIDIHVTYSLKTCDGPLCNAGISFAHLIFLFGFYGPSRLYKSFMSWVRSSRVNRKLGRKQEIPEKKTSDHPQVELGLNDIDIGLVKMYVKP